VTLQLEQQTTRGIYFKVSEMTLMTISVIGLLTLCEQAERLSHSLQSSFLEDGHIMRETTKKYIIYLEWQRYILQW
jgi:hypothetical protein